MERLVAEEYILDTMTFFEGDRVQCAQRLASEPLCTWSSPQSSTGLFGALHKLLL